MEKYVKEIPKIEKIWEMYISVWKRYWAKKTAELEKKDLFYVVKFKESKLPLYDIIKILKIFYSTSKMNWKLHMEQKAKLVIK